MCMSVVCKPGVTAPMWARVGGLTEAMWVIPCQITQYFVGPTVSNFAEIFIKGSIAILMESSKV